MKPQSEADNMLKNVHGKVGRYNFLAEPFHCDFSNRLFMGHLGNHLLNAADFHSNERDFGMHYLNTIHRTWVLSRLVIEMTEMPVAYTKFAVETWVEGALRFFTHRDFKVEDALTGQIFGYGRSVWAMIDTDTRQPVDLLKVHDGRILKYVDTNKTCPINPPSRVKMTAAAEFVRTIDTGYSDVDVNGHINSVKYIEHILDLWKLDQYREQHIRRFEIAYVAEGHGGDRLSFYREETPPDEYCVRVMKIEPNGGEPLEVCRSKVQFAEKNAPTEAE